MNFTGIILLIVGFGLVSGLTAAYFYSKYSNEEPKPKSIKCPYGFERHNFIFSLILSHCDNSDKKIDDIKLKCYHNRNLFYLG